MRQPIALLVFVLAVSALSVAGTSAQGLTCSTIADQDGAQIILDQDPSDPNGLDVNGDGQACEEFFDGVIDVDTDASGPDDTDDASGSDGGVVTLPEPAAPVVDTSTDPGTDTDSAAPGTDNVVDTGVVTDTAALPDTAIPDAAAADAVLGAATMPVSGGPTVAALPNTGAGPGASVTPLLPILVSVLLLLGAAMIRSYRRI